MADSDRFCSLTIARFGAVALVCATTLGCGAAGQSGSSWPPLGKKWFDRADASYRQGDVEDAEQAADNALRILPNEPKVRLLAARIALARLDYDHAIQLLEGVEAHEARSVRGRALWYSGRLERAADELEQLVADPEERDPWAVEVAKLARRGAGRKPFELSGGLLAVVEMPQVAATALVVPVELNGEPALALIHTGTAEAVVDSVAGSEPTWVSLRFGERDRDGGGRRPVEVKDVPALSKDLSGLSRQLNAPIKMLIGVNLLRHLHPTFDFTGGQFVVRTFEPPPPPRATTVRLSYVRGGGMLLRGAFGTQATAPTASLLVDTSMTFPLALDDGGWKKAGVDTNKLKAVPNGGSMRQGVLPMLRLGAFEVPEIPGVQGAPGVKEIERGLDMDLDGLVGSGLLAAFRVTLIDGGRAMWLEDMPPEALAKAGPSATALPEDLPVVEDEGDTEEDEPQPAGKGGKASKSGTKAAPKATPKTTPQAAPKSAPPSANTPASKPAQPSTNSPVPPKAP